MKTTTSVEEDPTGTLILELIKRVDTLQKELQDRLNKLADVREGLKVLCEQEGHDWYVEFVDGHNGDEHEKCRICGIRR